MKPGNRPVLPGKVLIPADDKVIREMRVAPVRPVAASCLSEISRGGTFT